METKAQEIVRLTMEIAERQQRIAYLVLGDQTKCVCPPQTPEQFRETQKAIHKYWTDPTLNP